MPRLRSLPTSMGLVALSLTLGLGSAALAVRNAARGWDLRAGAWTTSLTAGGADAGLYQRAAVAVHALFALNRGETLYYRALADDSGRPLSARCDYELRGMPPQARWWSLTAYGADGFLIPNGERRYSFNMANLRREPDGRFVIRASARRQAGNWLPLGEGGGKVSFTLRLYNPAPHIAADPRTAHPPSIAGTCP